MANVCRAEPLRRLLCSGPARGFLDPERAPVPARAPEALHSLAAEASEASARVGVGILSDAFYRKANDE